MGSSVRRRMHRLPRWMPAAAPYGASLEAIWTHWQLAGVAASHNRAMEILGTEAPGQLLILPLQHEQTIVVGTTPMGREIFARHVPFDARVVAVTLTLTFCEVTGGFGDESDWVELYVVRDGGATVDNLVGATRLSLDDDVAPRQVTYLESPDINPDAREVRRGDRFSLVIEAANTDGVHINTCHGIAADVYLSQIGRFQDGNVTI